MTKIEKKALALLNECADQEVYGGWTTFDPNQTPCTRALCRAIEQNEALRLAVMHYDAALKGSWPYGAKGDAWEHWNEARIILQEAGETFTHPDNQTPSE